MRRNCIYKIAKGQLHLQNPQLTLLKAVSLNCMKETRKNTTQYHPSNSCMIQFLNSPQRKKQKRANEGHKIDRKGIPPMIDPNTIRNAMRAYYDGIVKPPGHLNTNRSIASKAALEPTLVSRDHTTENGQQRDPGPRQRKMNTSLRVLQTVNEFNSHKRTMQDNKEKKFTISII